MNIKMYFLSHREHTAFRLRKQNSLSLLQGYTELTSTVPWHNALLFSYTAGSVDISHKDLHG
jgi:hypothetical protein